MTATVEQDADDVGDDDGEIDSEMMVRYIVKWSRFFCNVPPLRRFPSIATFATPEVVAEMIDVRTLDGCKDMMFEARTMFEVIEEVLDTRTLDVTLEMRMLNAQELIANLGLLTNGVLTKDVDRCSDMLTKGVDECKGICRMTLVGFNVKSRIASGVRMRMLDA